MALVKQAQEVLVQILVHRYDLVISSQNHQLELAEQRVEAAKQMQVDATYMNKFGCHHKSSGDCDPLAFTGCIYKADCESNQAKPLSVNQRQTSGKALKFSETIENTVFQEMKSQAAREPGHLTPHAAFILGNLSTQHSTPELGPKINHDSRITARFEILTKDVHDEIIENKVNVKSLQDTDPTATVAISES